FGFSFLYLKRGRYLQVEVLIFREFLRLKFRLLIFNIKKAVLLHRSITSIIVRAVWLSKELNMAVVTATIQICTAPIKAEAVPAFLLNGARDKAEVLGKTKP